MIDTIPISAGKRILPQPGSAAEEIVWDEAGRGPAGSSGKSHKKFAFHSIFRLKIG
jgi:hypothetical protein